jgi:hypothetical protein
MGKTRIRGRIFVVGCPRSGTTLLQSLLAAHPEITSFPESHFFCHLLPESPWARRLGIASKESRGRFHRFMQELGRPELARRLPAAAFLIRQHVRAFVATLDGLAVERGKVRWLEKTPDHLRHVDVIEAHLPDARFVHVVRNGPEVVASLYEVTHRYPETWHGGWSIDRCVAKWNEDVARTRAQLHKANHLAVRYERLVEEPERVLARVCRFLGIGFRRDLLDRQPQAARSLILANEPWKAGVVAGLTRSQGKFGQVFDAAQRDYISGRLVQLGSLA